MQSLPKTLADEVAKNLVMVARLIDEDPESAYGYSKVALRLASRVAAVREAAGFAAYANQIYGEALAEFRAARRMTGNVELWPLMADCERGLGRPEKTLDMAGAPEVGKLDKAGQVEMRLVVAGARRDLGQLDAAIVTLQSPELASNSVQPWTARLRYAYADALLAAGRDGEAREWFAKAVESDRDGSTDASDRLAELDGIEFMDALDEEAEAEEARATSAAVRPEGSGPRDAHGPQASDEPGDVHNTDDDIDAADDIDAVAETEATEEAVEIDAVAETEAADGAVEIDAGAETEATDGAVEIDADAAGAADETDATHEADDSDEAHDGADGSHDGRGEDA
ncbi:hypothetical protein GCM10018793_16760 [Streptomyces sulfonofaciens]|uniref:Tetratricopeptide repeat protein n=1 Tax=Streptomyces sulfonofaciens TaxID=68272 RepID=A0A919KWQ4_9ACTN|nr:hypothetical protein GCM10018793_16760 [Streptomyces sulfonofaciens]